VSKITTLNGAVRFSINKQKNNKTVGLVVGSFDILHLGHINLFRFANKYVDFLILGLDNDKTIKQVKGKNRPVNNCKRRSELLSDLETVDKIFLIEKTSIHGSEEAFDSYKDIVEKIKPTHILSHKTCDKHWKKKKNIAKSNNIKLLLDNSRKITNSGTILDKLSLEL
jgi:cytidyltransferase-like protein